MKNTEFDMILKEALNSSHSAPETLNRRIIMEANRKRKVKRMFSAAAAAVACAAVCFVGAVNISPTAAYAMYDIPVIGKLAELVSFRVYDDSKGYFSAHIEIPEAKGLGKATNELNREINEYISGIIKQYESDKAADPQNSSGTSESSNSESASAKYNITTSYDILCNDENYFSVKIMTTHIMASGYEYNKMFTVDKKREKIVSLGEILYNEPNYKEKLYSIITSKMRENMAKDSSAMYFIYDPNASDGFSNNKEFSFSEITGDENFYIKNGCLYISFNEYDVAPGSMGICEFNVGTVADGKLK